MKSKSNKKSMLNVNSMFNNMINNKYVLYVVALIALLDILGYIMRFQFSAVLLFYLIGVITFYYTKNMTVVLGSALIGTSLIHFLKNGMSFREGLNEGHDHPDPRSKPNNDADELDVPEDAPEDVPEDAPEDVPEEDTEDEGDDVVSAKAAKAALEVVKGNDKKSGYQNQMKLKPGLYNIPNKKQLQKQLGKADHMEAAYDNLEKVVGENGIQSMSNNTKELVRQQNELLKGLKEITPALNEAMGAVGKIDLGNLTNLFNKVKPE